LVVELTLIGKKGVRSKKIKARMAMVGLKNSRNSKAGALRLL
jgi:hypothetical protein